MSPASSPRSLPPASISCASMASTPMPPGASAGAIRTLSSRATRRSRSQRPLQPLPHCASAGRTSSGAYTRSILSSARAAAAKCTSSASSPNPCRSSASWIISASVTSSPAHLRTSATLGPAPLEGPTHPARVRQPWARGKLSAREAQRTPIPARKGRFSPPGVSGRPGQAHEGPLSAAPRVFAAKTQGQTSYPFLF